MKKILSFIVIAIGVMFGLASCSGDLHDKSLGPSVMGINGVWDGSIALKDGKAEFVAAKADHDLAILADGAWSGPVLRGSSLHAGTLPDGVSLTGVGVPTGPTAQNSKLSGLKVGVTYIIEVDIRDESNAYVSIYEKAALEEPDEPDTPTETLAKAKGITWFDSGFAQQDIPWNEDCSEASITLDGEVANAWWISGTEGESIQSVEFGFLLKGGVGKKDNYRSGKTLSVGEVFTIDSDRGANDKVKGIKGTWGAVDGQHGTNPGAFELSSPVTITFTSTEDAITVKFTQE